MIIVLTPSSHKTEFGNMLSIERINNRNNGRLNDDNSKINWDIFKRDGKNTFHL